MTEEKKKLLRNHIPTVARLCGIFLSCLDCPEDIGDEIEKDYLLEVVDKIEVQLAGVKDLLEEL